MVSHSSTVYPTRSASRAREQRSGMVTFAAVMLFLLAFFNGLYGIAAINNSRVFVSGAVYIRGDLRAWGWTILILAIAQAIAGISVLTGGQIGRWFGVLVLGLNAFAQMWVIPAYPLWAIVIIAMDVMAIYALCVYGGRPETDEELER